MMLHKPHKLVSGVTFVFGGARSGKSEFCEKLVMDSGLKPIYLATARAEDEEMKTRIAIHRQRRKDKNSNIWQTVEEPLDIAGALHNCARDGHAVLVDCLTLWVSNLMMAKADVAGQTDELIASLGKVRAPVVFVSSEVGMGIVPQNAMAREFRDLTGMVHQKISTVADHVYFIAAGLPLVMKAE